VADFSLEDLITPLSVDEVRASLYSVVGSLGVDTTNWKPGAVVRTLFAATAICVAAGSQLTSKIARMGVASLSEGDWLTLVARYQRNVERITAGFASGTVLVSNSGGGVYDFDPDELVVRNTTTKKTYVNTSVVHVGSLESNVAVAIRAVESGSASSAFAGEIVEFETPQPGLTVINLAALAGLDAESDPALLVRYDEKLGSLSPGGAADAYNFIAKSAVRFDGTSIGVTRTRAVNDAGYGTVTIYCATDSGAVPGTSSDPATDIGKVNYDIQRFATPLSVTSTATSATPVTLAISYTLAMRSTAGLSNDAVTAAVEAKLATLVKTLPIGGNVESGSPPGKLFKSAIEAAIASARPEGEIFHVNVTLPAADYAYVQVSDVVQLGTVTGAITQV